jgi:hypothetical protein
MTNYYVSCPLCYEGNIILFEDHCYSAKAKCSNCDEEPVFSREIEKTSFILKGSVCPYCYDDKHSYIIGNNQCLNCNRFFNSYEETGEESDTCITYSTFCEDEAICYGCGYVFLHKGSPHCADGDWDFIYMDY